MDVYHQGMDGCLAACKMPYGKTVGAGSRDWNNPHGWVIIICSPACGWGIKMYRPAYHIVLAEFLTQMIGPTLTVSCNFSCMVNLGFS
jgi:hypothetical protein